MGSIHVRQLGKAYRQYPTRWARLGEWLDPRARPRHALKWVLQDVGFDVAAGEAVGIIGINGAGKSTLLKMIVGTTQPTTGSITMQGRVAALLELGMGFHPDFSGRQNVIMSGQLLGLQAGQMHELMPSIEAFAEIGDYIDQPVRVYSSGMQVRLAFAVATAERPDILIVDEALSVGDAYFQHKSFDRIREFRRQGTTLLLVSHDRMAIQSICDRVVLLDSGRVARQGPAEEVLDFYNALIAHRENSGLDQTRLESGRVQTTSGTGQATVSELTLLDSAGAPVEVVDVGAEVTLRARVEVRADLPKLVLGYMIKDRLGQPVFGTNTHYMERVQEQLRAGDVLEYHFSFPANIGPGSYSITTALTPDETHLTENYEWRDMALLFTMVNLRHKVFIGCNWMEPRVEVRR